MLAPVMSFSLVDSADDEAGQVVFTIGIEAGHLGSFSANEGASVGVAGLREAADDLFGDLVVEASGGEVIEKEERRRALDRDVVDAVIDEVGAHGVVNAQLKGDLELGSHAIRTGDQDRILVAPEIRREEAAKAADFAKHLLVEGLLRESLDPLLGPVATGDVDAGVGVGNLGLLG